MNNPEQSRSLVLAQYHEFSDYVRYKETGLRQEAFHALDSFLETTVFWNTEEQRAFVRTVFVELNAETRREWCSYPLLNRLLIPAVLAWRDESPDDPVPYFAFADLCTNFSGKIPRGLWRELVGECSIETDDIYELCNWPEYMSARKAMELAPDTPAYRVMYIEILIKYLEVVDHNTYSGFPGVPFPAAELEDFRRQLDALPDSTAEKARLTNRYQEIQGWFDE